MGRTTSGAARSARPNDGASGSTNGWVGYFSRWMDERGLTNAELARQTGLTDSAISKYRRGASVPDIESCRRIGRAIRRPLLEVLVAAGHLEPAEARLPSGKPPVPQPKRPDDERLARLERVMNDPKTPDAVRERLALLLDVADDVGRQAQRGA